ncbi:hypothetical protein F5146DRAFT_998262 [Armillaria mellea]|nr:hypothetical protein F5146DRAFT_998262 [Armillaria mellea]
MNFQSQSFDISMELHPSQLTGPVSRSRVTSSTGLRPQPLGPNTQTSRLHPGCTAPILAITGEATSNRFLSSGASGSAIGSLFSLYRGSHDVDHLSTGLHPTGPELRQTSQPPWIGPTAPVLTTAGETTSTHFTSSHGSGYTTEGLSRSPNPAENAWSSPVNPGDVGSTSTDTNAQPMQPSSTLQPIELDDIEVTCLLCGARSHLREKHPALVHKSDKLLCPLCTTPAKEVTNFCRHFQKHHKVLRFKCPRCSYKAFERWNVNRHVENMKCAKD